MNIFNRLITVLLLFGIGYSIAHAETVFTYQGKLGSAGQPANGAHDFRFRLFDAETGGTQAGSQLTVSPVTVSSGLFTVQLDFGDAPFNSSPRWLEIDVRAAGGGAYMTLSPRQRVGASPFAIETVFVGPGAVDSAALQDNSVTTNKIANGNVLTDDLANFAVSTGKLSNQAVTRLKIADDAIGTAQIDDDAVTRSNMAANAIGTLEIENNTVGTDDIRDGSITSNDVDGSIFTRKGQVYSETATADITFGIQGVSVSCAGARDLLIQHVCNVPSDDSDITVLSQRLTRIDTDVLPARLRCTATNRDPQNSETLSATVWCLSVP